MKTTPSNTDDIIDSRDIISRHEELRDELDSLLSDFHDAEDDESKASALEALQTWLANDMTAEDVQDFTGTPDQLEEWGKSDDVEELAALQNLVDEAEGYGDWRHGETLIREGYFEKYAQDLADDIGAIDRNAGWPLNCTDWEQAARELKTDYMEVSFNGETYLMRA